VIPAPHLVSFAYASFAAFFVGEFDHALRREREGLALLDGRLHPFSAALVLHHAGLHHAYRGELDAARLHAEALVENVRRLALAPWELVADCNRFFSEGLGGHAAESAREIRQNIARFRALGPSLGVPALFAFEAQLWLLAGRVDEGLAAASEGLAMAQRGGERWFDAELLRIEGALRYLDGAPEAATALWRAVAVAREQGARSFELRALSTLCEFSDGAERAAALEALRELVTAFSGADGGDDLSRARWLVG
jgi:hypothetical protein